MNKISVLNILHDTTVDGPGFRTSIYAAGCIHRCLGCHNPHSWNIAHSELYSVDDLLRTIKEDEFANVTFSGGDPLMQVDGFTELARRVKAETNKTIWCYTGYRFEEIIQSEHLSKILPFIDVLVDGRFVMELKDESLLFRGSDNQRLIDVKDSLRENKIVLYRDGTSSNYQRIDILDNVLSCRI